MVVSTSKFSYEYLGRQSFFNAFKPMNTLPVSFEVPTISLKFSGKTDQESMQIKGMGFMQDVAAKNIFVGTPAAHCLADIARFAPEEDRIRPGHIGFDAFVAWVYLMKGAHIFTTILAQRNGLISTKNILTDGSKLVKVGEKSKIITLAGDQEEVENKDPFAVTQSIEDILFSASSRSYQNFPGSFIQIKTFAGPIDKGIFYPFFTGMLLPDKVTAHHVFEDLFLHLLADTQEQALKLMSQIRGGIKQLAFSRSGIVLSHLYKGIDLARKVPGSKMTIVLDAAVYQGFIICGEYNASLYGKLYTPGDVMKQLKLINKFASDCEMIAAKLNTARDALGTSVYNFQKESFMRSRSALEAFYSVDKDLFASTNTIQEVIDLMIGLRYSDSFPIPSIESLRQVTAAMLSQSMAPLQNFPAFFDETMLKNLSPLYIALSAFGPKAPSINTSSKNKGAQKFVIPSRDAEDVNIKKTDGKRFLQYLPYEMVPIHMAVAQYNSMFQTGVLHLAPPRKGKKEFTNLQYTIVQIGDDVNFGEVYMAYKEIVNNNRILSQTGAKRKRDGDELGARKKSKQDHLEMADLF